MTDGSLEAAVDRNAKRLTDAFMVVQRTRIDYDRALDLMTEAKDLYDQIAEDYKFACKNLIEQERI